MSTNRHNFDFPRTAWLIVVVLTTTTAIVGGLWLAARYPAPTTYAQEVDGIADITHIALYGASGDVVLNKTSKGTWAITATVDPVRHHGRPPMLVYKTNAVIFREDFEAMKQAEEQEALTP